MRIKNEALLYVQFDHNTFLFIVRHLPCCFLGVCEPKWVNSILSIIGVNLYLGSVASTYIIHNYSRPINKYYGHLKYKELMLIINWKKEQ